jgi:hypothetical protein
MLTAFFCRNGGIKGCSERRVLPPLRLNANDDPKRKLHLASFKI